jgi:hypothetical protein
MLIRIIRASLAQETPLMPQQQAGEATGTRIEFLGFAADCRVEGRVDLQEPRLADLLNEHSTITVYDVTLTSTADGHTRAFPELEISRDELDIVVASGPRGDPKRRLATRLNGVTVKLGPYSAEGFLHGPPAANPIRSLDHKPTMVAITDAVLEYAFCDKPVSEWFRALLVNRELAQSVRTVANPGVAQGVG